MGGIDSIEVGFDCDVGPLDVIGGGSENPENYFEVDQVVRIVAVSDGAWRHIAIFDDSGDLIMGSHDLSEDAIDFTPFLEDIAFDSVDTECEPEVRPECTAHRIAVDFTLGGQMMRIYDGTVGEVAGFRIYPRALFGDAGDCGPGPYGYFSMYRV
jgi:hypothetical protein